MCEDVFESLNDISSVRFIPYSNRKEFLNEIKDAKALVVGGAELIDEEFLKNAPELKIIARFGVGYDNVDVEACTKKGVYVTYTPGVLSNAVAELTIGLILCLSRRILEADRYVKTKWARDSAFPFGIDLEGKTLGIIGLGQIGCAVAYRTKPFDMKLVYYDVIRKQDFEETLGARFVKLDDLLKISDFVTIHIPLTSSTRGLIGERELKLMKKKAYLINTSRGPIVDEEALCRALTDGWIAGAALDVFVKEPLPLDSPLVKLRNILLTPHIGSATVETRRRMAQADVESIRRALQEKSPPNLVPEQKGKIF
jgi:glyoxylate reductase